MHGSENGRAARHINLKNECTDFDQHGTSERVAISNARLVSVSADAETVAFRWKDYRIKSGDRQKVMLLATPEFIRRFLIHVLPDGFHRIRHYGLLASSTRKANITKIRALLCLQRPEQDNTLNRNPRMGKRSQPVGRLVSVPNAIPLGSPKASASRGTFILIGLGAWFFIASDSPPPLSNVLTCARRQASVWLWHANRKTTASTQFRRSSPS